MCRCCRRPISKKPADRDRPAQSPTETGLRFYPRIADIGRERWSGFFGPGYPFLSYDFLHALEVSRCVSPRSGWEPAHAVLESRDGTALAAAPIYRKAHSYGEFVFDFSWANASHRIGLPYYPKWLIAAPFTPATGPRFGARDEAARIALIEALRSCYAQDGASSMHALFLREDEAACAENAEGILRQDIQFHWRDRAYGDFKGFVGSLSSDKRKKILRERRRVAEAGIRFETRKGNELSESEWAGVYSLYSNTYEERGQAPYLNLDFFLRYAAAPDSPYRLMLAYESARTVAVALTVQGGDTLYGRHWGAAEHYHSLHFETCYYQGIDYCLAQGLQNFDAGAQGEHKLARGFEPVLTTSAHWIGDSRLQMAVRQAMEKEREQVADWRQALAAHRPFRKNPEQGLDDAALTLLAHDEAVD